MVVSFAAAAFFSRFSPLPDKVVLSFSSVCWSIVLAVC